MVLNCAPVAVYPACSGLICAVPVLAPAGIASASAAAAAARSTAAGRQGKLLIAMRLPLSSARRYFCRFMNKGPMKRPPGHGIFPAAVSS